MQLVDRLTTDPAPVVATALTGHVVASRVLLSPCLAVGTILHA